MSYLITKASGQQENFDAQKVCRSLQRAGAKPDLIESIIQEIEARKPKNTHELYRMARALLKKSYKPAAVRYNLKRALLELGPAGFPFEKFVAELFKRLGYQTVTDQHITGACVEHEIDVVASKNGRNEIIECKFHNSQGIVSDVKVPLYVKARFDDILKAAQQNQKIPKIHNAWVVTNTRFSTEAIQYAECIGMHALDWSYPKDNALAQLIDRYTLYPITTLDLTGRQKKQLIENGLILCEQAQGYAHQLAAIGMKQSEIDEIIQDSKSVCSIGDKTSKRSHS